MRGSGYLQWIVIILAAIMLLLGVIAWQFVGDDVGRSWSDFWWEVQHRYWRYALGWGASLLVLAVASGIWNALFPPAHVRERMRQEAAEREAAAQREIEARGRK